MLQVPSLWVPYLKEGSFFENLVRIETFLDNEKKATHRYFPQEEEIFYALQCTPYEKVKVVLVGQDPYHGHLQAHGLSFSVPLGISVPPSLQNVYKELYADLLIAPAKKGNLRSWAQEGVFLLNAILTVEEGKPLSHHQQGWEEITDAIIEVVAKKRDPVVFLLWGKKAQEKCRKFNLEARSNHLVLQAAHPSPFSANHGFFGCRHFSKTNDFLRQHGVDPVDWRVN